MFSWSIIALQYCLKFLLYNKVVQLYVCIYLLPLNPPACHPHPTYRGHHRAQSCAPHVYSSFALRDSAAAMPMLVSQFIPPLPLPPTVHIRENVFNCILLSFLGSQGKNACPVCLLSLSSCRILSLGKCNCLLLGS